VGADFFPLVLETHDRVGGRSNLVRPRAREPSSQHRFELLTIDHDLLRPRLPQSVCPRDCRISGSVGAAHVFTRGQIEHEGCNRSWHGGNPQVPASWITVDGNEACAAVAYQLSDVVAIYPITP